MGYAEGRPKRRSRADVTRSVAAAQGTLSPICPSRVCRLWLSPVLACFGVDLRMSGFLMQSPCADVAIRPISTEPTIQRSRSGSGRNEVVSKNLNRDG